MNYWVYVHTCPNGKRYVGITTYPKPEYRWQEGRGYCRNKHFSRAIRKYGWSSIKHEAWELTCESEMYYAEKYLIAYYNTTDNKFGYNHSTGGEKSALGCKCSEETRRKISKANRKRWSDPEYRGKMLEVRKGRGVLSEEARRHLSEANKKKWSDPEYKKRVSEAMKGKSRSEETRRKIAEAQKGKPKPHSEEHKRHIAEAMKGKHQPRIKIKLPNGTTIEIAKNILVRDYVNKNKAFQYVS